MGSFTGLMSEVRACTICAPQLPHAPRPVLQLHQNASILIAGQAPGRKVHESGVPFDDASGKRLREWMGVTSEVFYNPEQVAILPMGFCYPGKSTSGDLPPLKICATTWRQSVLAELSSVRLTLIIGQYAQKWHLDEPRKNLTETVRAWSDYDESIMPMPHPSPRNNIWLAKNRWFEKELLPTLKKRVADTLGAT